MLLELQRIAESKAISGTEDWAVTGRAIRKTANAAMRTVTIRIVRLSISMKIFPIQMLFSGHLAAEAMVAGWKMSFCTRHDSISATKI